MKQLKKITIPSAIQEGTPFPLSVECGARAIDAYIENGLIYIIIELDTDDIRYSAISTEIIYIAKIPTENLPLGVNYTLPPQLVPAPFDTYSEYEFLCTIVDESYAAWNQCSTLVIDLDLIKNTGLKTYTLVLPPITCAKAAHRSLLFVSHQKYNVVPKENADPIKNVDMPEFLKKKANTRKIIRRK